MAKYRVKYTEKDRAWIVKRYQEGLTVREVAAARGCSYHTAYRFLKESNVQMRPRGASKKRGGGGK